MHMFCIILADGPHGSCKHTFLKSGLRVEKSKNAPIAFSCVWRICILCILMTPSPHPSTSSLRLLNTTTSHNNVVLHACVHFAEDIEPIRFTRTNYYAALPLHWAKNDCGQLTSHFRLLFVVFGFSFYCLFAYSVQALCTCSVSSSQFWGNFKAWNMKQSVLSHLQWIHLDANILEIMPRKTGGKKM